MTNEVEFEIVLRRSRRVDHEMPARVVASLQEAEPGGGIVGGWVLDEVRAEGFTWNRAGFTEAFGVAERDRLEDAAADVAAGEWEREYVDAHEEEG